MANVTLEGGGGLDDMALLSVATGLWRLWVLLSLLVGLFSNCFITLNILLDEQMRTTNYFFVMNLVLVDIVVIIGKLVVKEMAAMMQTENPLVKCFSPVWNFVVNYTASNYILLFLCYEKFVLILLPFQKDRLLRLVPGPPCCLTSRSKSTFVPEFSLLFEPYQWLPFIYTPIITN